MEEKIYLEKSLRDTGYDIVYKEVAKLFGLPVEITIGLCS